MICWTTVLDVPMSVQKYINSKVFLAILLWSGTMDQLLLLDWLNINLICGIPCFDEFLYMLAIRVITLNLYHVRTILMIHISNLGNYPHILKCLLIHRTFVRLTYSCQVISLLLFYYYYIEYVWWVKYSIFNPVINFIDCRKDFFSF